MNTSTIIWIIVIVVVVLLIAALASFASTKRKERQRVQAEELRGEAAGNTASIQDTQLQAEAAEAEAQRMRAEAERAAANAAEARQGADVERAQHEDKVRTADRIDPDVDHTADDYRPAPLGTPEQDQPPVSDINQAPPPADPQGPGTGPTHRG